MEDALAQSASVNLFGLLMDEVQALREEVRRIRQHPGSDRRLLSFREAALALGVSRTRTLPVLIRRGLLRPVVIGRRKKIPAVQIEQLAREGFSVDAPTRKRAGRPVRIAGAVGMAAVRALKI